MEQKMEPIEVNPTWRLAWGLWWKMLLMSLAIGVIIYGPIIWFIIRPIIQARIPY